MKTLQLGLALAMIVLFAGETRAQDGGELTRNKDCMTWHALEQEKTGTSFKSIAAQSKAQAEAAATLEAELKSGRGHVKAAATDAELQQMIACVLAIRQAEYGRARRGHGRSPDGNYRSALRKSSVRGFEPA